VESSTACDPSEFTEIKPLIGAKPGGIEVNRKLRLAGASPAPAFQIGVHVHGDVGGRKAMPLGEKRHLFSVVPYRIEILRTQ
jgi:hypothetical protein